MSITLRDIARRAHVSTSTVSRVLNDYPHVSEGTREAVIQVAHELGYAMDNLRHPAEDSRTALLLIRDTHWQAKQDIRSVDVDGIIAFGAQSVLSRHGMTTRIQATRMERGDGRQFTNDPTVTGLIAASGVVDHDFVRELQAAGVPFVIAGSHVRPLGVNCVMADYEDGTDQAVRHLVEAGHRRIGLVNGPSTTTSSAEKLKGFRLGLSLYGMAPSPSQILACEAFTSESGYTQTLQLLAQAPDLDGIVYASDGLAMGGLYALKEGGRRVPDDVAVTGFYDYELARFTDPPLTTVHIDLHRMGAIAARRLLMMLQDPEDDQAWCVVVPTSLVVRDSA
jgi:DNA-binding LacI/PurR family transcriptional regulator